VMYPRRVEDRLEVIKKCPHSLAAFRRGFYAALPNEHRGGRRAAPDNLVAYRPVRCRASSPTRRSSRLRPSRNLEERAVGLRPGTCCPGRTGQSRAPPRNPRGKRNRQAELEIHAAIDPVNLRHETPARMCCCGQTAGAGAEPASTRGGLEVDGKPGRHCPSSGVPLDFENPKSPSRPARAAPRLTGPWTKEWARSQARQSRRSAGSGPGAP